MTKSCDICKDWDTPCRKCQPSGLIKSRSTGKAEGWRGSVLAYYRSLDTDD